jgi:hypothetical protein
VAVNGTDNKQHRWAVFNPIVLDYMILLVMCWNGLQRVTVPAIKVRPLLATIGKGATAQNESFGAVLFGVLKTVCGLLNGKNTVPGHESIL